MLSRIKYVKFIESKHIYEKDMLPFIEASLIKDFQIIEKRGKEGYIYVIVQYISKAGEVRDKEKFFNLLEENLSEKTGWRAL